MRLTNAHAQHAATYDLRIVSRGDKTPGEPDIYETCSYCGSIDVGTLLMALKKAGTSYTGCKWIHGYPHKFYVKIPCTPYRSVTGTRVENGVEVTLFGDREYRDHRFYYEHFKDATAEQIADFNEVGGRLLGIKIAAVDGKIAYSAPAVGWQTHGIVSQHLMGKRPPVFDVMQRMAPVVPDWFIERPFDGRPASEPQEEKLITEG